MKKTPYPSLTTWRLVFDVTGGPASISRTPMLWVVPGQELRPTADGLDWEVGPPPRTRSAWKLSSRSILAGDPEHPPGLP